MNIGKVKEKGNEALNALTGRERERERERKTLYGSLGITRRTKQGQFGHVQRNQ